jgi:hypothetical protein
MSDTFKQYSRYALINFAIASRLNLSRLEALTLMPLAVGKEPLERSLNFSTSSSEVRTTKGKAWT